MDRGGILIALSGLPGTGKTTIGKALAARRSAVYLRIDEIEHALQQYSGLDQVIGAAGYIIAFAMASSNLKARQHRHCRQRESGP